MRVGRNVNWRNDILVERFVVRWRGKCTRIELDLPFKFTKKSFVCFVLVFLAFLFFFFFSLLKDQLRFVLQKHNLRGRGHRLVEDLVKRPLKDLLAVSLNLGLETLPGDARTTALSILVVCGLGLVHLDGLPLLTRVGERNTPQDKLVLQPEAGIQEVDDVPVLLRTEGRRPVRGEALTLLGLLLVADEVPRNLLPLLHNGLGPLGGAILKDTRVEVKNELHDILADVLRHIGEADGEARAGKDGLGLLHIGLVESKASPQNLGGVGVDGDRLAGTTLLGVSLEMADCTRHLV